MLPISRLLLPLYFTSALSTTTIMAAKREIYVPSQAEMDRMTPDAKMWYLTGVSNGKKDLAAFQPIAAGLEAKEDVKPLVKTELQAVLKQAVEANENTKVLVPKLTFLVNSFVSWTRDPSWLDKIKMKTTMAYVKGKRDNKSYYLQNGAGLWFKLRLDDYLIKIRNQSPFSDELTSDFDSLGQNMLLARDTLDNFAQQYVQGMAQLDPLIGDIGANVEQIRAIVDRMKAGLDAGKEPILQTAADTVAVLKAEIKKMES